MITMKDLGIIRRLYYRDGLSLSEIERRTGLTRKTVRRWLNAAEKTEPKYRRRPAEDTKIAPFAHRAHACAGERYSRLTYEKRTAQQRAVRTCCLRFSQPGPGGSGSPEGVRP
jgi:transposase